VFALHLDEGGHDRAHAEAADVAAENSAQQRSGDAVEDFGAEVAKGEICDTLIVRRGGGAEFRGSRRLGAVGRDGGFSEERRVVERSKIARHDHVEPVGHSDEAAGWMVRSREQNPDPAGVVVGRDKLAGEAEFGSKFARPRLGRDPAIGAALDGEAAFADSVDQAAEAIRGFKQHRFDGRSGASLARDFVCGGEAGDSASEDGNSLHVYWIRGSEWDMMR